MAQRIEAEDIVELEACLSKAKQPRVIDHLQRVLDDWRNQMAAVQTSEKQLQDTTNTHKQASAAQPLEAEAARPQAPVPTPVRLSDASAPPLPVAQFTPIQNFGWDQDPYPGKYVSVYIVSGVDGVGACPERVRCKFTPTSFDLQVHDLDGKNLRLFKDNLDKDIVPGESKYVVKKNRITIKLRKAEGQYGVDHWTNLTGKRKRAEDSKVDDPSASIMEMMRDLYEEGDDNMRKTIGEAMLKSRQQNPAAGDMDL